MTEAETSKLIVKYVVKFIEPPARTVFSYEFDVIDGRGFDKGWVQSIAEFRKSYPDKPIYDVVRRFEKIEA